MAISGKEIQFVGPGVRALDTANGSYVQNMIYYNNSWETRKGFGQMGEWTSALSRYTENPGLLVDTEGYKVHLGSYLLTTSYNSKQIFSVFLADVWDNCGVATSIYEDSIFSNNRRFQQYVVSIYDVKTRQRWEELLYRKTAVDASSPERMPLLKGYYQTHRDAAYNTQIFGAEEQMHFTEFEGVLYFGNHRSGVWAYRPSAFIGSQSLELETIPRSAALSGKAESSLLYPLVLADGIYSDNYTYYKTIPLIKGMSRLGKRLLYINDYTVYFADEDYPSSVVTGHALTVPSETPITTVQEINGNLLIYTETETFLYRPSAGFFVNQGNLTKISTTVGCISAGSLVKFKNTIAWVDRNGVYVNSGSLEIKNISNNIKPFFEEFLSNPLSSYHTQLGKTNLNNKQPRMSHKFSDKFITLVYNNDLKALFITFPSERITLVYNENTEWSIWNYDSMAFSNIEGAEVKASNKVGVRQFMNCQQLLSDDENLFVVGLDDRTENKILEDEASTLNRATGDMEADIDRTQRFRSYFIGRYGCGGSLDRSIHDEDNRYGIGEWNENAITPAGDFTGTDQSAATGNYFDFIIGKPQKMMPGFSIDGTVVPNTASSGVLVPLMIRVPREITGQLAVGTDNKLAYRTARTRHVRNQIYKLQLKFQWDKAHWAPIKDPALVTQIQIITKSPGSLMAAGMGNTSVAYAQVNGVRECQIYNAITGLADTNGNEIRISWDGPAAGDPNATSNFADLGLTYTMQHFTEGSLLGVGYDKTIAAIPNTTESIFTIGWIPFTRLLPEEAVSSMAIESQSCSAAIAPTAPFDYYRSRNYWFGFSSLGSSASAHKEDGVAQGVDWAYLSEPIGLGEGAQIKARGLYTEVKSQGMSAEHFDNGWSDDTAAVTNYRLLNSVVSADNSQWMGQVVDQPGIPPTAIDESDTKTSIGYPNLPATGEHQSIRTKILDSNNVMKYKSFDEASNQWGTTNTDDGTVLIDDQQFGTISQSNSTRGEWVNWMFFGFVLDKAEKLVIRSAKAVLRKVSGRRRKGHSGGKD